MNKFERRQVIIDGFTTQAIHTKSRFKRALLVWLLRIAQAEMRIFMRTHTVSSVTKKNRRLMSQSRRSKNHVI